MGFLDKIKSFFDKPKELDVSSRFEIMREAITGTMSDFHVVREIATGKILGLKLLDMEKTNQLEARFKGLDKPPEGKIAMSLKHPLIVETYEYGVTNNGQTYILMEYVKGTNLHVVLNNRDKILEGKRLKVIRQMAEALEVVHAAGYIHRDISPRNYMFHPETGGIKLIDFGLTVPFTKEYTQPGNRTGTPQYMSPEVVRRRVTDQRLDIFSLGVSAYEVCVYDHPWETADTTGKAALAHDSVPPTSILKHRPRLNRILADAIMSCLAVTPEQRPETVSRFLSTIKKARSDDE